MTTSWLDQALADYLSVRRALGFKLDRAEKLLNQFLRYLHEHDADTITIDHALGWATLPADAAQRWWAHRLSTVRRFAVYLHALDTRVEVPPPGLFQNRSRRASPYLYSETDVAALIGAAACLPRPLRALTHQTLIGLLAVTGMRIGEAIGLDREDFDARQGLLRVRCAKFGKTRLLPLHPSTVSTLRTYLQTRDLLLPQPSSPALLISITGTRLRYNNLWRTFRQLVNAVGLDGRPPTSRPRIHDLRHSFAVATMVDWYAQGRDVPALLPHLSTYLGHTDPKHTYWYLTAAPQLLAHAAHRLDTHQARQP
jgi:integrase/recombinase XerD